MSMKIIRLTSKSNPHCVDTKICNDNEVQGIIATKSNNWNIMVNEWFG